MTLNFSTPGCCCCWGSRRPVAAKSRRPRGRSKAAAEQRLQLGVSGNPELAPGWEFPKSDAKTSDIADIGNLAFLACI